MADEQPAQKCHRKRLDHPVDEQGDADALEMRADFAQRTKVHFHQHRNDHHPDQQANRQIDVRDLHAADGLENARQQLSQANPGNDTQENPYRQVAFECVHMLGCHFLFP